MLVTSWQKCIAKTASKSYHLKRLDASQQQLTAETPNLQVEDGWAYFIHGWTRVIAKVFDIEIPTSGPEFKELSRIGAEATKKA